MSVHTHEIILHPHESERLPAVTGERLAVKSGAIWLTQDDREDIILQSGDCFEVAQSKDLLISALQDQPATLRLRQGDCAA